MTTDDVDKRYSVEAKEEEEIVCFCLLRLTGEFIGTMSIAASRLQLNCDGDRDPGDWCVGSVSQNECHTVCHSVSSLWSDDDGPHLAPLIRRKGIH